MLIAFLKLITLLAENASSPSVIFTDSQPVDDENNVLMTFHLMAIPYHVSSGTLNHGLATSMSRFARATSPKFYLKERSGHSFG